MRLFDSLGLYHLDVDSGPIGGCPEGSEMDTWFFTRGSEFSHIEAVPSPLPGMAMNASQGCTKVCDGVAAFHQDPLRNLPP